MGAIICKICCCGGMKRKPKIYSGKPQDYIKVFCGALNYYPYWPETGKSWARSTIASHGNEKGIATITHVLTQDSTGHMGTKSFTKEQQKEIAEVLLADAKYMEL